MSEQQITKRQHYVPKMYLKRWCLQNEDQLLIISKNHEYQIVQTVATEDELFYQDFCYDVSKPMGNRLTSNEVEHSLGEYEKRHAKLLIRILERCEKHQTVLDKGTNRIKDFLEFVTLMVIRNPNNNIPFSIDAIPYSTLELDVLLAKLFGKNNCITALQIVSNSVNQKYLFKAIEKIVTSNNLPDIYFLESPPESHFITSDNPVLCADKWSYIPLSPRYATFILYDTRIDCPFEKNKAFSLLADEVKWFNSLYWKQKDVFTIIADNEKDLKDGCKLCC